MTHTALKMARDALADLHLNVSEAMRTGGWVPTPLHQSFWQSMVEAANAIAVIDALQSTHPADASIVGAQIDMRDSVPSAEPRTLTDAQIERHTFAAGECPPNSQVMLVSSIRRLLGYTATTAPAPAQAEPVAALTDEEIGHVSIADARLALDNLDDFSRMTCSVDPIGPRRTLEVFISQVETPPAAAAPLAQPLTDEQILTCVRSVGLIAPMGLTRDRGPYEVTEPTHYLCELVRAIERAHGIKGQP